jgi:hypothetical protein
MNVPILIVVPTLIAAVVACSGIPKTSRTGEIHNVKIEENLSPTDLTVRTGDEIRWVNARTMESRIDLLFPGAQELACERGFGVAGDEEDSATLGPNESASICFSQPSEVRYNVRMGAAVPGGEKIVSGLIRVVN